MRAPRRSICAIKDCNYFAVYGPINTAAILCVAHKHTNTLDLTNVRCIVAGCTSRPVYYKENSIWTHCIRHHTRDMKKLDIDAMYYINKNGKCCECLDKIDIKAEVYVSDAIPLTSFEIKMVDVLSI